MNGNFFDGYMRDMVGSRNYSLFQWLRILEWLRSHQDWQDRGKGSDLERLCEAVCGLEYDTDECFLTLYIFDDKGYLNDNDTNRALLLRLAGAGQTYNDRPLGFPEIRSLNIVPRKDVFSPGHLSRQSGLPSPDITHIDLAPNAMDAWI